MFKNKKMRILLIIMIVVFSLTFYFGIFANPKFNIHDFFMNLSSEIFGIIITLVLVDTYINQKKKEKEEKSVNKDNKNS